MTPGGTPVARLPGKGRSVIPLERQIMAKAIQVNLGTSNSVDPVERELGTWGPAVPATAPEEVGREAPDEVGGDGLRSMSELQRERDRHLRTRAEFENYRRRAERDRAAAAAQGRQDLLLALVELADDFDRAVAHVDETSDAVAVGLFGTQRRLARLLEVEGVRPFASLGLPFDPNRHQAVTTASDTGYAAGTVVDELARGYLWNERLLRAARVRVAE